MNRHLLRVSLVALPICLLMVFACASAVVSAAAGKTDTEAACIPNEVIVMFNSDTVKDSSMSLKAARRMENVAPGYGSISEAVGDEDKAAKDAKGEVEILTHSLGDDFVIEDSMIFDAGSSGGGASTLSVDENAGSAAKALTLALVSSDKYDTETMIRKLYAFVPSGGNEGTTPGTMPVWCYDIASNTWTRIEDLPYDTRQPLILSHDGKIYFMFGHDVLNPHSSAEDGLTDKVYCLDDNGWKQMDDVRYIGRFNGINGIAVHFERCAEVKNGFVFMDSSSCVETRDGIYYIVAKEDEFKWGYELYFLPASSGAYESK